MGNAMPISLWKNRFLCKKKNVKKSVPFWRDTIAATGSEFHGESPKTGVGRRQKRSFFAIKATLHPFSRTTGGAVDFETKGICNLAITVNSPFPSPFQNLGKRGWREGFLKHAKSVHFLRSVFFIVPNL